MLVIDPPAGTHVSDVCQHAAHIAVHHCSRVYVSGMYYAFLSGTKHVVIAADTEAHLWDYLRFSRCSHGAVVARCEDDKPGVRVDFNEIELSCTDPNGKTEGDIVQELVSQYEAKHQARYDAYWTPERRAEEAEKMREHAKEMKQRQERIDLAQQAHPFQPSNPAEYSEWRKLNSNDGYSRGVVTYMEAWAALMEAEIAAGKSVAQAAEATQNAADVGGITGFMYGCARSALAAYWHRGLEFKRWSKQQ